MVMTNDMPTHNHSYVFNPEDAAEMARLTNLDRATTQAMGGALAGLPDLPEGAQVLDLGCGPGGWVLDVAFERPDIEVAGVDISQVMTDYANARARSQHLPNASFGQTDIRQPLDFSDVSFDLVNARFLIAAIYRDVWPSLLQECYRILRKGGLIRLTEPVNGGETNSLAFERMQSLIYQAGKQMGYGFSLDGQSFGMSYVLPRLLRQAGFHDITVQAYAQDVSWEAKDAWTDFHSNARVAYQFAQPLLVKQGLISWEEVASLYQQMEIEMHQRSFAGMWHWVSVIARKSGISELEGTL
jgi:ubiquinone/menaquinone biosynthesis C-methylase UbiE